MPLAKLVDSGLTPRDEELKKHVADLEHRFEQKTAVDQLVHEIATRQQARRDKGENGITYGDFIQMIAQERQSARTEFKAADEKMQHAFEAKLAQLRSASRR